MPTPRLNWVLFILLLLAAVGAFVAALIFPGFRAVAYAPLRELLLPPPRPVVVHILYSTEKAEWLEAVVPLFQATDPRVDGRPIELVMEKMGSREMYLAVLDGTAQPDLISPASSLQIAILQDLSASRFGAPVVNSADQAACRSVVESPLVIVAWRERAQVLWGNDPNGNMWLRVHDALVNPQGWEAYGHPEWGYIKFSHTNPLKSNSGFMTILLMTYNYFQTTSGLTSADILSDADYQQWFVEFEGTISNFGDSTGTYMEEIVAYGPSLYDLVAVYEATAIEHAENAVGRYGELQIYYPPATLMSDHPFCVLQANWVTPEEAEAAQMFVDFLTSEEAQQVALLQHGFRPVHPGVPLDQPGSPFQWYIGNGLRTDLPPEVELPPGDVLNTLLDFWIRNV
ncbi:MAG: substrate-binding domain-containing protein, partial [Anaerolineae bacterium]|nr:substrate-binding domain-containing protein [Anaerolineae bacterium]